MCGVCNNGSPAVLEILPHCRYSKLPMKDQSSMGPPATPETAKPSRTKSKSRLPNLVQQYYAELTELAHQNVMYEMGTLTAVLFQHGSPTSTTRVEWPIYRDESTRPTSNASVGR